MPSWLSKPGLHQIDLSSKGNPKEKCNCMCKCNLLLESKMDAPSNYSLVKL